MDRRNKDRQTGAAGKRRRMIQVLWAFLTNSYLVGFVQGKIYRGKLKNLCVPGLNCYSCPGAVGSCPIGAMQAVIGSWNFKFAFYAAGFLMFIGALMGRFVCGWLCPFGLIQDLLYKIPFLRKINTFKGDFVRQVRWKEEFCLYCLTNPCGALLDGCMPGKACCWLSRFFCLS